MYENARMRVSPRVRVWLRASVHVSMCVCVCVCERYVRVVWLKTIALCGISYEYRCSIYKIWSKFTFPCTNTDSMMMYSIKMLKTISEKDNRTIVNNSFTTKNVK